MPPFRACQPPRSLLVHWDLARQALVYLLAVVPVQRGALRPGKPPVEPEPRERLAMPGPPEVRAVLPARSATSPTNSYQHCPSRSACSASYLWTAMIPSIALGLSGTSITARTFGLPCRRIRYRFTGRNQLSRSVKIALSFAAFFVASAAEFFRPMACFVMSMARWAITSSGSQPSITSSRASTVS